MGKYVTLLLTTIIKAKYAIKKYENDKIMKMGCWQNHHEPF